MPVAKIVSVAAAVNFSLSYDDEICVLHSKQVLTTKSLYSIQD